MDVPFNTVQVRLAIMSTYCIQEIIENSYAYATASLTHRCYHTPFTRLWVVTFYT